MRVYIDDKDVPVLMEILNDAYYDVPYGSDKEKTIERLLDRIRKCEVLQIMSKRR